MDTFERLSSRHGSLEARRTMELRDLRTLALAHATHNLTREFQRDISALQERGDDSRPIEWIGKIELSAQQSTFEETHELVKGMRADGFIPDARVYMFLLVSTAKAQKSTSLAACMAVLKEMKEEGSQPQERHLKIVLRCAIQERSVKTALAVYDEMLFLGIPPAGARVYSNLQQLLNQYRDSVKDVLRIDADMKANGIERDPHSINHLLLALIRLRDRERLTTTIEEMISKREQLPGLRSSARTVHHLIKHDFSDLVLRYYHFFSSTLHRVSYSQLDQMTQGHLLAFFDHALGCAMREFSIEALKRIRKDMDRVGCPTVGWSFYGEWVRSVLGPVDMERTERAFNGVDGITDLFAQLGPTHAPPDHILDILACTWDCVLTSPHKDDERVEKVMRSMEAVKDKWGLDGMASFVEKRDSSARLRRLMGDLANH